MNREQYLTYRNNNDIVSILYRYYLSKSSFRLDIQNFIGFFNIWKGGQEAIKNVLNYYDIKFNITILESKERKQLKFY